MLTSFCPSIVPVALSMVTRNVLLMTVLGRREMADTGSEATDPVLP